MKYTFQYKCESNMQIKLLKKIPKVVLEKMSFVSQSQKYFLKHILLEGVSNILNKKHFKNKKKNSSNKNDKTIQKEGIPQKINLK